MCDALCIPLYVDNVACPFLVETVRGHVRERGFQGGVGVACEYNVA